MGNLDNRFELVCASKKLNNNDPSDVNAFDRFNLVLNKFAEAFKNKPLSKDEKDDVIRFLDDVRYAQVQAIWRTNLSKNPNCKHYLDRLMFHSGDMLSVAYKNFIETNNMETMICHLSNIALLIDASIGFYRSYKEITGEDSDFD